jgi:hypothetical protein
MHEITIMALDLEVQISGRKIAEKTACARTAEGQLVLEMLLHLCFQVVCQLVPRLLGPVTD